MSYQPFKTLDKALSGEDITHREKLIAIGEGVSGLVALTSGLYQLFKPKESIADMLSPDYYVQQGEELLQKGNYKEGVKSLAEAVKVDSSYRDDTLQVLERVTDDLFSKHTNEAYNAVLKITDEALKCEFYNNSAGIYNQRGSAFRRKEDIQSALKEYKIALDLDPNFSPARQNIAHCYFKLGQYQNSYDELTELLRRDPTHQKAINSRNNLIRNYGQYIRIK